MKILSNTLILLITLCLSQPSVARTYDDSDTEIGMVTGSRTGTYIAFGNDIAREAAREGVVVRVYDSKGSVDNIRRITSKEKVGLAIVQSDVLGFLSRSRNAESIATAGKLRLVAPFYDEEVHILAGKDITSLQDLAGKKVVVGDEGSGSMITAVNIFSILGIVPANMYQIDPAGGVVAVLNHEVDALVFVGGKPVKMFKNMEDLAKITEGKNAGKLAQVHFLPVNDPRLLKEYKPATLTHNDYNYISEDIPGVSVTALLVTYDYTMKNTEYYEKHCRTMQKLTQALYKNSADLIAHGHPKWQEVDLNAEIGNWKRDGCSQTAFAGNPGSRGKSLENDLLGIARGK